MELFETFIYKITIICDNIYWSRSGVYQDADVNLRG